jgi:DNA polymerase-4
VIIHLDLDAFFASAEITLDKSLAGKAVAIGGRSDPYIFSKERLNRDILFQNRGAFVSAVFIDKNEEKLPDYFNDNGKIRGIVTTCSYEARKYGIKTGMSISEAKQRCTKLIVIKPNHVLYHKLSQDLRQFISKKAPLVEQFSIDEFFIDLSGWIKDEDVYNFSKQLQSDVTEKFDLPCSIGISQAKWIAKLATEQAKPYGIKEVNNIDEFIHDIKIEEFPGIGKATCKRLHKYKKFTLGDIQNSKILLYSWGNQGKSIYDRVCGIDYEPIVEKFGRKSVGISRTFDPITCRIELKRRLYILSRHVVYMVSKLELVPTTLHISIQYTYDKKSRHYTFNRLFNEQFLTKKVIEIFQILDKDSTNQVIKLSISLSNFISKDRLNPSVLDINQDLKFYALMKGNLELRAKYGIDILRNAQELI